MILTLLLSQGPTLASADLSGLFPGEPGEQTVHIGGRFMEDFSFFSGRSGQVGWFLTGESRGYKAGHAVFGRVRPARDALDGDGGSGAWEIAGRVPDLDLTAAAGVADELDTITVALNWYVNPHTRFMLDVTRANLGDFDATIIFALRVAFDF
jgi:phosphate-selective porin OprO/OprP